MIRAVLFDLDNTLVDFMLMKRLAVDASVDAMIEHGLELSKAEALKIIYGIYSENGIEDQMIFEKFLRKVSGGVDEDLLGVAISAYRQARAKVLFPYEGVEEVLKALQERGLKLAIVSDAPKPQAIKRLKALRLEQYFPVVVAFEDTNELKPNKLPFEKALKLLGVKAEESVMVGDNSSRDIQGAKSLGMKTVLAKYGVVEEGEVKADYEIASIKELLTKVLGLSNKNG